MVENVYWSSCTASFILVRFCWKLEFARQIFEKYPNIKFHENPPSGTRVVPCGQMDRGQTDMTKLIVAIRNSANAPKKKQSVTFL